VRIDILNQFKLFYIWFVKHGFVAFIIFLIYNYSTSPRIFMTHHQFDNSNIILSLFLAVMLHVLYLLGCYIIYVNISFDLVFYCNFNLFFVFLKDMFLYVYLPLSIILIGANWFLLHIALLFTSDKETLFSLSLLLIYLSIPLNYIKNIHLPLSCIDILIKHTGRNNQPTSISCLMHMNNAIVLAKGLKWHFIIWVLIYTLSYITLKRIDMIIMQYYNYLAMTIIHTMANSIMLTMLLYIIALKVRHNLGSGRDY